jgi:hypothetical protein
MRIANYPNPSSSLKTLKDEFGTPFEAGKIKATEIVHQKDI